MDDFSLVCYSVRRRSIKTEQIAQWLIANKDSPTFLLLFYWSTDIFNIHKKPQQLKRIRFWHAILLKGSILLKSASKDKAININFIL